MVRWAPIIQTPMEDHLTGASGQSPWEVEEISVVTRARDPCAVFEALPNEGHVSVTIVARSYQRPRVISADNRARPLFARIFGDRCRFFRVGDHAYVVVPMEDLTLADKYATCVGWGCAVYCLDAFSTGASIDHAAFERGMRDAMDRLRRVQPPCGITFSHCTVGVCPRTETIVA